MATIVKMPKWGLTMTAGTIVDWLIAEGSEVSEGDMLLTVETEKAVDDVSAPATGVLYRIVAPAGSEVAVTGPMAIIVALDEAISEADLESLIVAALPVTKAAPVHGGGDQIRERRTASTGAGGRINASPAARKRASELGVELSVVEATGPNGRITSDDVERTADETADVSPEEFRIGLEDGREINVLQAGPRLAQSLVFIHGLGGSLSTWQLVLGELASRYRVTAVDLPGHGNSTRSDPASTDYSIRGLSNSVSEALQLVKIKPSVIVGHSLGGAVALELLLNQSPLALGAVLIDSAGLGQEIGAELLDLMEGQPGPECARGLLELFFADQRLVADRGIQEMTRYQLLEGAWSSQQAIAGAAFSRDGQRLNYSDRLAEVSQPVFVIWGASDRVIPLSHAESANRLFPDSLLKVFTGIGHVPQVERSSDVSIAIDRFVKSLS